MHNIDKLLVIRQEDGPNTQYVFLPFYVLVAKYLLCMGFQLTVLGRSYTTYLIRHEPQAFDYQLQQHAKSLTLRGLETTTYRGSPDSQGIRPTTRQYSSESLKLVSKGSLTQDLELQLPNEFFTRTVAIYEWTLQRQPKLASHTHIISSI